MASSINASLTNGLVQTADTSGVLNLQSGGTTVATISSTGLTSTGGALNGTLGATTPSTVAATTISSTSTVDIGTVAGSAITTAGSLGAAKTIYGGAAIQVAGGIYLDGTAGTGSAYGVKIDSNVHGAHGGGMLFNVDNGSSYTAMTLDASGGLKTLNTIGVGAATPSTSGAGITFPATQSASTDVNTLDDYEEGTWTPVGTWTTQGTGSTVVTHANYTKIGRVVTITTYFSANRGTASGTFTATGLPFASVGAIGFAGATIGIGATSKIPMLNIQNASTTIQFNFLDQATTYGAAVTGASMAATDNYIQLAFSYTTS